MTFKFAWLCELLNELERQQGDDLRFLERGSGLAYKTTTQWFAKYQHSESSVKATRVSASACEQAVSGKTNSFRSVLEVTLCLPTSIR